MFVSFIDVKDLDKFFKYLKTLGIELEEGMHSVLLDSSEVGIWYGIREGKRVLLVIAHYIDAHYEALAELPSDASDRAILEALLRVSKQDMWYSPVEPVIVIALEDELGRALSQYIDEVPNRASEYLKHYEIHGRDKEVLREMIKGLKKFIQELK